MSTFAKVIDDKVVNVIVAEQDFIDSYDDGLGGEWIQTSNNAGLGFTYDRENDAFVPWKPYPSFVLNNETFRWQPPISYPEGMPGGPNRFVWDEEYYQAEGKWKDLWEGELSYYNPESEYYDSSLIQYGEPDYPYVTEPYKW